MRRTGSTTGLLCILLMLWSAPALAQLDNEFTPSFEVGGYVKYLYSWQRLQAGSFGSFTFNDHLIHHRLNTAWYAHPDWTVKVELRNRLFYGDQVREIPGYENFVNQPNDYFDLSVDPVYSGKWLWNLMLDRAFVRWSRNDWEVSLGRQRINWGTTLVWNPNDIFNAYSFYDFDYEERPGADALRVQYYTGFASSVQFAVKMADNFDEWTAAGLWKKNIKGYDYQLLGGVTNGDAVVGAGWAGNIKTSGFKGELSYFIPLDTDSASDHVVAASFTWDYSFSSSVYVMLSGLYMSNGDLQPSGFAQLSNLSAAKLTAKNLSPYRYNLLAQVSYPFHPLLFGSFSVMTFPGDNALYLFPVITYSLKQNLDLDLVAQVFLDDGGGSDYVAQQQGYFVRVKFSY